MRFFAVLREIPESVLNNISATLGSIQRREYGELNDCPKTISSIDW